MFQVFTQCGLNHTTKEFRFLSVAVAYCEEMKNYGKPLVYIKIGGQWTPYLPK